MTDERRTLPSVNALLETDGVRALLDRAPRTLVVDAVRQTLEDARRERAGGGPARDDVEWATAIGEALRRKQRPSLRPVINATGVVLHTNLGRAPLPTAALDAIQRVATGYANLEYDLESGGRGSRYAHCAALLRELTGAEDAVVVNNGAAALVLVLDTIARSREVIVSRGELVEIGGSFRVPEIMAKSGALLVEVGTTNRTHPDDYRRAIRTNTAAIVKVHRSNFALEGFVADVPVMELAAIAASSGAEPALPVIHDLGSGLLIALDDFGLSGEPTARQALRAGANVVCMSGDKLLGGPQAGLLLGDASIIDGVRRNPLARSYRVDKLTLAALEATLDLYREPARALREIPVLAMLTAGTGVLRERGQRVVRSLGDELMTRVEIVDSEASVGGGAFPTARIPSIALALTGNAMLIERRLRDGDPPVIARVSDGRTFLDLRTVAAADDDLLAAAIAAALV